MSTISSISRHFYCVRTPLGFGGKSALAFIPRGVVYYHPGGNVTYGTNHGTRAGSCCGTDSQVKAQSECSSLGCSRCIHIVFRHSSRLQYNQVSKGSRCILAAQQHSSIAEQRQHHRITAAAAAAAAATTTFQHSSNCSNGKIIAAEHHKEQQQ